MPTMAQEQEQVHVAHNISAYDESVKLPRESPPYNQDSLPRPIVGLVPRA